jgi:hypothetical protein
MAISNGYASLNQIKAALRITDTVDDTLLEMAVESASRLIDGHTGRSFFNSGTATRYYVAQDDFVVQIDDMAGTAGLVIRTAENADGVFNTTFATTDYQLEPVNRVLDGLPWVSTRIRAVGDYFWPMSGGEALVEVTSNQWGWPSVPTPITQACIIQASRIFKRLDSPLGVAGFGDLGVMRVSRDLDPDVAALVSQYRRTQVFA